MEAYAFGFPLVIMDVTRAVTTAAAKSGEYSALINQFGRMRTYVDPDFKNVVRISRNSLWSFAFVDLDKEPFVYSQPDTRGRYMVMQALNMWTDDFASVGSRTTGTEAGNFLIAGPKWSGTPPPDVKETFRCTKRYAWVLVQIAAGSAADFPEIHLLQDKLALTPLSAWGKPYTPPASVSVDPRVDLSVTPYDSVRLMTGEMFFWRHCSPTTRLTRPTRRCLRNSRSWALSPARSSTRRNSTRPSSRASTEPPPKCGSSSRLALTRPRESDCAAM